MIVFVSLSATFREAKNQIFDIEAKDPVTFVGWPRYTRNGLPLFGNATVEQ